MEVETSDIPIEIDRLLVELTTAAIGDYVKLEEVQDALLDLRSYVTRANVAS